MKSLNSRVFLLVAILAAPASALRGVEPGAQCQVAEQTESELGSKLRGSLPKNSERPTAIFFDGTHLGHEALVSYTCDAGVVASQLITIKFAHEDDARLAFAEFKRALVGEFGEPANDMDEPTISDLQDETYEFGLPVRRFATWLIGKRGINLMLSGDEDSWELLVHGP